MLTIVHYSGDVTIPVTCYTIWKVACPHYLAESTSWLCFCSLFPVYSTCIFYIAGTVIMSGYAKERQENYKKAFPLYSKSAFIPGIY